MDEITRWVDMIIAGTRDVEPEPDHSLEDVLAGKVVELWSDSVGRLFLVADEEDAAKLGEPRGQCYTAGETRHVISIGDPAVVAEVHRWKRRFDAVIRDVDDNSKGKGASDSKQSTYRNRLGTNAQ